MTNITTKRLILRDLKVDDLNNFFIFASSAKVGPLAGWEPHKNINETKMILNQLIEEKEMLAITINNQLIGTINLTYDAKRNFHEIGFSLHESYWNQGIMSEALRAMIKHIFDKRNIKKIVARHYEYNQRSKSVLLKIGFKFKNYEIDTDIENNEQLVSYYELTKKEYKEVLL